jgi:hypothetical protein
MTLLKLDSLSISLPQGRHLADGRGAPFNSQIDSKMSRAALLSAGRAINLLTL